MTAWDLAIGGIERIALLAARTPGLSSTTLGRLGQQLHDAHDYRLKHDTPNEQLAASPPAGLRVEPIAAVVAFVASTDEYARLLGAGRRFWRDLGHDPFAGPAVDVEEVEAWIASGEHASSGWMFYGTGDLSACQEEFARTEAKLIRLSPTHIALLVEAQFSASAVAEFGRIAVTPLAQEVHLRRRHWIGGHTSWAIEPRAAEFLRRDQFDDFFERSIRGLATRLRKHGARAVATGSLIVMGSWGKWLEQEACRSFWRAVRVPVLGVNRYSKDGVAEFLARGDDEQHDVLLLDVSELSKDPSSYGTDDVRAIALHKSGDDVTALMRGVAATAELGRLESAVATARRYVMQAVRGRSPVFERLGWVPGYQLRALDRMQFDAARLARSPWLDKDDYTLKAFARAGIRAEREDGGTLNEDWVVHLARRVGYVTSEIEVLRDAFQSRIGYALQWVGLVVATASVLVALPAEWRWVFWPLVAAIAAGLLLERFR